MENWTKIQCGNDEFNLQHISFTLISARSTRNKSTAMAQLRENIENVLNKYWYAVAKELPSPHPDYINKKKSTFSVRGIEQNGEAEVVWEYWYDTNNPGGTFVAQSTHSLSLTKDIIPSIEKLLKQKEESIKKAGLLSFLFELAFDPVNTIFHDDSTKEQSAFSTMKQELSDVYKQYLDEQKFEEQHELLIFFNNGRGLERYLQDKCGFDIFEKEKEINQKLLEYKEKQYDAILYPEIEDKPPKFAISKRNEWMMERANLIIAYVNRSYGGAYQSLQLAKRKKKRIINICDLIDSHAESLI